MFRHSNKFTFVPFLLLYLLEKENQKNNKTLDESNMNLCKSVLSTSVQEVSWIIHLLKTVGVWGDDVAGWVSPVM